MCTIWSFSFKLTTCYCDTTLTFLVLVSVQMYLNVTAGKTDKNSYTIVKDCISTGLSLTLRCKTE